MIYKIIKTKNYLLVVDDSKIKQGDWYKTPLGIYSQFNGTEKLLNGTKRVSAHLPLNGSAILEGVDLLPPYPRHQEDGLDNAVMEFKERYVILGVTDYELSAFSKGYNKACLKYKYTEEDMRKAIDMARPQGFRRSEGYLVKHTDDEIIKSFHQDPTEFECDTITINKLCTHESDCPYEECEIAKTTTNSQGQRVWVGKYK